LDILLYGRLLKRVERIPGFDCWIWIGRQSRCRASFTPYGAIKIAGRVARAHRVMWESTRGAIPPGMHVCHRCDVTLCVNPAHLFLGTSRDNMRDCASKGRLSRKSGWRNGRSQGTLNPRAKLTDEDIRSIRSSAERSPALASRYRVNASWIRRIRLGAVWKHTMPAGEGP